MKPTDLLLIALGMAVAPLLYAIHARRARIIVGAAALVLLLFAGHARAAEVGSVAGETTDKTGRWSFTITDEVGVCSGAWKRAVYRQSGSAPMEVEGCWTQLPQTENLRLVFVDGDAYVIPRSAFKDAST